MMSSSLPCLSRAIASVTTVKLAALRRAGHEVFAALRGGDLRLQHLAEFLRDRLANLATDFLFLQPFLVFVAFGPSRTGSTASMRHDEIHFKKSR